MTQAQRSKAGTIRWLWEKCREHATNAAIGGGILVVTGFTPEHWVAHLLDGFHLSDLRTIWPSYVDPRLFVVSLGIVVIVADVLWHKHRITAPVVDFASAGEAEHRPKERSVAPAPDALPLPDKPSIAVLPFRNMSGDPEQEYFSDGITEEITTTLSKWHWFFVISRNSAFVYKERSVPVQQIGGELGVRYVLEGSVRKSGERIRVTAQLVEAQTGNQIWGERYDKSLTDIFAVQDEITETIVAAIGPQLGKFERHRATTKRPENLDAWDLYQRGMSHLYQYTKDDLMRAREFFEQAIAKDANFGLAHSGLAEAYYYEGVYGFANSISDNREKARASALQAVALDAEDAGAHCTLGRAQYMCHEYGPAIRELKTALEINPNLALAHYGLGAALVFSGQAGEAVDHLNTAIRLSPSDPNMGSFLVRLADAAYFSKDYEGAVDRAMLALQHPHFQWSRYTVLIAALGQLGRFDEARGYLKQLQTMRPNITLRFVQETHLFGDADDFTHYLDGLRKAGLPE